MKKILRQDYDRFFHFKSIMLSFVLMMMTVSFLPNNCLSQPPDEYETPGTLDAYKILPPKLLEGENYWVDRHVVAFGFTNRYTLMSRYGQFDAHGEDMLRIRIQEIKAIEALQEIKKSKAFGDAAKNAIKSPIKGAKALITNPVETITGVPKGVGRFLGRFGEMAKGGRGEQEDSYAAEIMGLSVVKRKYAHELGVDVYSSNPALQKELNSVAWAGFAGGLGVSLAMLPIKGASEAAFFSIQGTKLTYGMNQILLDNSPEDLQKINREKLKQMGVEDAVISELLKHPNYSPRHTTILAHALAEMAGVKGRDQLIKQALYAEYEEEALFYQRMAELLHGYHTLVRPLSELIPVRKVVMGYNVDKDLIATLPTDDVYWTDRADLGTAAIVRLQSKGSLPVRRVEVWITGRLTPRARQECNARGLIIKEGVSDILMPPSAQ
ncbi:MAG: hypothetical protein D8M57_16630 [Candidatus Scalindua sp. AMX11]|nr:MAG: hypothetical protein DWQ00_06645 [Candidatus Scalindua sp.]NOG84255.1 hypothetical protein [Planctomycetota bacterium]RZV68288.1 MAG: hypothetical protein EX341_16590 [Candidatus Scalindua sp. SCAELEC01]TDE63765.1 MAG: hypothetical protein D8M57_16630 [Candidatus Scalindua sp. AMX11]GJQ60721.1 MAG: hypothetical protein SCALA701_35220 [Candidatus Scalindua sp.]